jgi:hypothetical protein
MGKTGRNTLMPTITYNIPSDKQADVVAALRAYYGTPNATPTQLNDLVTQEVKARIRNIYKEYMQKSATFDVVLD